MQVRRIWSDVLGRPVDDIDADFFELGGHSLLAARVVSALRKATGFKLTVQHLYAHASVGALAAELDRIAADSSGSAVRA